MTFLAIDLIERCHRKNIAISCHASGLTMLLRQYRALSPVLWGLRIPRSAHQNRKGLRSCRHDPESWT